MIPGSCLLLINPVPGWQAHGKHHVWFGKNRPGSLFCPHITWSGWTPSRTSIPAKQTKKTKRETEQLESKRKLEINWAELFFTWRIKEIVYFMSCQSDYFPSQYVVSLMPVGDQRTYGAAMQLGQHMLESEHNCNKFRAGVCLITFCRQGKKHDNGPTGYSQNHLAIK